MAQQPSAFAALERNDGYLPIEDHGLIGDGTTAALVGRDGGISWLCVPRFDSEPLFAAILDRRRGGAFTVQPEGLRESRQYYVEDTGVLITEMRASDGVVRVTDALTLRGGSKLEEDAPAARGELVRRVEVLDGRIRLRVAFEPRGEVSLERVGGGVGILSRAQPELRLHLSASRELEGPVSTLELSAGEPLDLVVRWGHPTSRHQAGDAGERIAATVRAWQKWAECIRYEGPQPELVRRSTITLKLLDHFENGAIVAAPTTSLPEAIGGERNWDYRFTWVRDAALSVYALRRVGLVSETEAFLAWVLDAVERHGRAKIMYDLDGEEVPQEEIVEALEGYRASRPVRFGNAAAHQTQNDVYGEIIDCAYQWAAHCEPIDEPLWQRLRGLIETAGRVWREPDHGIWEVRTEGHVFTYSAAMCQVALDRGAKLAESLGLPGDAAAWRQTSERIRRAILEEGWDEQARAITERLGDGGGLDASVLSLPLRRVVPADHPRMVATAAAVADRLGAGNGLLYRYDPNVSPDGLAGHEGAFLLCSFWLVDNLAHQGRLDEAQDLYDCLCSLANPLGLLPEQIDPSDHGFLGNFPQAFSHIGVISSGFGLGRLERRKASGADR